MASTGPSNNETWMGVCSDSSARNQQVDYPCRFQQDEHFLFGHEAPSCRFDGHFVTAPQPMEEADDAKCFAGGQMSAGQGPCNPRVAPASSTKQASDFGTFYDSDSEMSRQSTHYDLGRLCGEVLYLSRQGSLDLKNYQASDLSRQNSFNLHHEAGSALPCEASSDLYRQPAAFGVGHAVPQAAASGLGNGMALCGPSFEQTRREAHAPSPSELHFAPLHMKSPEANFVAPGPPRPGHAIAHPTSAVASSNFFPLGMMMMMHSASMKQKPRVDRKRKHL